MRYNLLSKELFLKYDIINKTLEYFSFQKISKLLKTYCFFEIKKFVIRHYTKLSLRSFNSKT